MAFRFGAFSDTEAQKHISSPLLGRLRVQRDHVFIA